MAYIYILVFLAAFVTALVFYKSISKFLFRVGIRAIDQQKSDKPLIPTSAGIIVLIGTLAGIFLFIGVDTFILQTSVNLSYILAAAFSIFIITFIGFFDDMNVSPILKKDKGLADYRIGLKQWQKPLLVLPAAIPLMAVRAGVTEMALPIIGAVNFGILYPLVLIPLAVVFVTNATNMLAGMNGLEAGLGFVATLSIGLYAFFVGRPEAAIIALSAAGALGAILLFNWYPAKILPGDTLTYLIGASIITSVVIGNIEKFGIIIFSPWIIEFFLKLRSKLNARSLGELQKDGTLRSSYKKVYSLTHVFMRTGKAKERKIAVSLILLEILICLVGFFVVINYP